MTPCPALTDGLWFVAHRSNGVVGRLIRWQTDGAWSHISILLPDGRLLEAREGRGVVRERTLAAALAAGDAVRVLHFPCSPEARAAALGFAEGELGQGYDYVGIVRFLARLRRQPPASRWFCSELATATARHAGAVVSRDEPAWMVTPHEFACCPEFEPRALDDVLAAIEAHAAAGVAAA